MSIGERDVPIDGEEQYCYLTTVGRRTGRLHTIEIWFALSPNGKALYMLSGGGSRSDWVKNIGHGPGVQVRIAGQTVEGKGRVVEGLEEELLARRLVVAKYYNREYNPGGGWEASSLVVAVDLQV